MGAAVRRGHRDRFVKTQVRLMLQRQKCLLFCLCFCSPVFAELKTDIEFAKAGDVSLTLDAHVPDGAGPFPTVIIVHGGGFVRGDKQTFVQPLFEPLTRAGFAWFTINYRLAPQYRYPAPVEDVEQAIHWVKQHASEYRVDPRRMALLGESAGGYLVSMVGAQNKPAARVKAVVAFFAPSDLEALTRERKQISEGLRGLFGLTEMNEESLVYLRKVSPIQYVQRGMPPFLLIHGTEDELVSYSQSVKMHERMTQLGLNCELFTVEGGRHGVGPWEKDPKFQAYKEKMVAWLKNVLR